MASLSELFLRTVDGIFAVDTHQRIVLWDAGCAQLFGVPAESALGSPCAQVLQGRDLAGRPFCRGGCCVARLAEEKTGPGTFPLYITNAHGRTQRLAVGIVLVPASKPPHWCCVHLVRRGEAVQPLKGLEAAPAVGRSTDRRRAPATVPPLTAREQELLKLLAEGSSIAVIARLLSISVVTVRNHMQHIQTKLGVHSQVETVAYAYRHQLV